MPRDIGELTQCHDRSGMPDQEEKSTTRLQMHSTVTSISDMNDIDSHANPSDDGPDDGECLNIPQDRMTHDIRRDSILYDSTQQILEEPGENIMWTWPIVNIITTARIRGAHKIILVAGEIGQIIL